MVKPQSGPLVSVLTPVYDGEPYLAECIESVLRQSYSNFEYIIVNNCSSDRSLEIALGYAKSDSRIKVRSNDRFVEVIENHNIAFRLMSPSSKYCKLVSADDFLFPDCIARMVEVAENNSSVGIVGSYQISGSQVKWQGFQYPKTIFTGREVCRRILLGEDKSFGHGAPTSMLYRADLVRKSMEFFPNSSPHADTTACFEALKDSDYGFVYQVLSYERIHSETQGRKSEKINMALPACLNNLIEYGPVFLSKEELRKRLKKDLNAYHRFLAFSLLKRRNREFWEFHRRKLKDLGHPITVFILVKGLVINVLRELLNPEQALRKAAIIPSRFRQ